MTAFREGRPAEALNRLTHPSAASDPLLEARIRLHLEDVDGAQAALLRYTPSNDRRRDAQLWRTVINRRLKAADAPGAWNSCTTAVACGALDATYRLPVGASMRRLAAQLNREGDFSAALHWLDHPGCLKRPLLRAKLLLDSLRLDEVEAELLSHVRDDPTAPQDAGLWRRLIKARLLEENYLAAWKAVNSAAHHQRLQGHDRNVVVRAINLRARDFLREGKLHEAIRLFKLIGESADAVAFARSLLAAGQVDAASKELMRPVAHQARGSKSLWRGLFRRLNAQGAWTAAINLIARAVATGAADQSLATEAAKARRQAAIAFMRAGQAEQALKAVDGSSDVIPVVTHARLLFQTRCDEVAVKLLRRLPQTKLRRASDDECAVLLLSGGSSGSHLLAFRLATFRPFFAGPELNVANDADLFSADRFHRTALRRLLLPQSGRDSFPVSNGSRCFPIQPGFFNNADAYGVQTIHEAAAIIGRAAGWSDFAATLALAARDRSTPKGTPDRTQSFCFDRR